MHTPFTSHVHSQVWLPFGYHVDRTTIARSVRDGVVKDPFSRARTFCGSAHALVEDSELKAEIEAWRAQRAAVKAAARSQHAQVPLQVAVACRLRLDRLLGGFLRFKLPTDSSPCSVVRWPDAHERADAAELSKLLRDDCFLQRHLGCVPFPVAADAVGSAVMWAPHGDAMLEYVAAWLRALDEGEVLCHTTD
jgi:hypothetical protein